MEYVSKYTHLSDEAVRTVVSTELTSALGYPNYEDKQDSVSITSTGMVGAQLSSSLLQLGCS